MMEMDTADTEEHMNGNHESTNFGDSSRSSKLARKAESARQARLRHKQYVGELQEQVLGLQRRCRTLEAQCGAEGSAANLASQLKQALKPEQHAQLLEWMQAAQGEENMLQRYAAPPSLPPTPVGPCPWTPEISASKPIAVGRGEGRGSTFGGESSTTTFEADDGHLGVSRSWGDIEGARSILNLNTPEGFHPMSLPTHPQPRDGPMPDFSLGLAAASSSSAARLGLSNGGNLSRSAPSAGLQGFTSLSGFQPPRPTVPYMVPSAACPHTAAAGLTLCGMMGTQPEHPGRMSPPQRMSPPPPPGPASTSQPPGPC
jgi:hypothetical protein